MASPPIPRTPRAPGRSGRRPPGRLILLVTLGALLGGCFSVVPRERARTLGEGSVEASAGASVLAGLDVGAVF